MSLHLLPPFVRNDTFRVVVESPREATIKLKFDPELQVMSLSRPLPVGLSYPFDWGFIPGTRAPDGDPIDAMLLWDTPSFPGVVFPCRAVGVVKVDQRRRTGRGRERNDRVLALPMESPRFDHLKSVRDIPVRLRRELENFFIAVTALENKDARVLGWEGPAAALRLIRKATPRAV